MTVENDNYSEYMNLSPEDQMVQRLRSMGEVVSATGWAPLTFSEKKNLFHDSNALTKSTDNDVAGHVVHKTNASFRDATTSGSTNVIIRSSHTGRFVNRPKSRNTKKLKA